MNPNNNRAHHSNNSSARNGNPDRPEAYDLGIHDYRSRKNSTRDLHQSERNSRSVDSRRDRRDGSRDDSRRMHDHGESRRINSHGDSRRVDSRNRSHDSNSRRTDSRNGSQRISSRDNASKRLHSDGNSRRISSHDSDTRRAHAHEADLRRHESPEKDSTKAATIKSVTGSKFFLPLILVLGFVVLFGIGAFTVNYFTPIQVTVNGQPVEISGFRTVANAVETSDVEFESGDLLAVDGSLLQEGAGEKYSVTIDGEQGDSGTWIEDGDSIVLERGADKTEDVTIEEVPLEPSAEVQGVGAIHVIDNASSPGRQKAITGKVSGITTYEVIEEADNVICTRVNIDTGGEKVIALTFDDGPNTEYTTQILDILAANDASATFFTVGDRITGNAVDVVKRAYNEGHQISTHSWDHAAGSGTGTNLSFMSPEEQVDEIVKGYEIIAETTGHPASTSIRAPGGNFPASVIANLADLVTYEIGWNIDSNDWRKPGAAAIESAILSADPGDIILMHDGGGDRSQTVAALRSALPILRERGYRFVTIDQLLEYL